MISALAYTPRRGPLNESGALAASVYLGSFALVALLFSNPVVLAGAGVAVLIAGIVAHATAALRLSVKWGLALGLVLVAINGLVSQRGDTILIHGITLPPLGTLDVSAEALAEGAVLALRVVVVMMAFSVHAAAVDPDGVFRLLRPFASRSALTAALIARMVPLAAADHGRIREAAALRGPGAAPVGRAAIARRLLGGSLDRSVDVAATLELRGYARGAPRTPGRVRGSRHDLAFLGVGVTVIAVAIAARVMGFAGFDPYPTLAVATDPLSLALAAVLPLLAAAPFIHADD